MKIKGKPKNLESFLSGGSAERKAAEPAPATSPSRITKTIRISPELDAALKEAAYTLSRASGRRVTESDVIHEALNKYIAKKMAKLMNR